MTLKKNKVIGIVCTVVLHLLVLLLLFFLKLTVPAEQEEGGVPVMLGNTELAEGEADPYTLTEVDMMPSEEPSSSQEAAEAPAVEQPMITQQDEPSLQVKKETPKKETPKKEQPKKTPVKTETQTVNKPKEKTEAEKRAEAEKAAAQAAANKIAGAFGKGSQMGSKGNASGAGLQGSPTGNSSTGKTSGVGGYGTFDLNGRSLGSGNLPVPVYNVQDEGRVVVTIVVNPAGQVISTSINKRTNTVNPALRRAAEEAARKARFNAVDGVNNQSGTITYYFKLR
ncbi:TonB family C-terminal domain [uncultured Bacteroides sp.]|nr:TonB family C-terminal domain [uncultured Bacteroides sp.]